ncbi:MAG: lipopolysaccharide heptosyltransferase II [Bacteroidota bacterium]
MRESLHKTLIIRFSSIGDIVLSSLLVRTLRASFPQAEIDYLVKSEYADLIRHNPHLSRVIEFAGSSFADLSVLRRSIHADGYDLIIDIHDSLRSRYLCFGHPNVVRINKRKLARFLLVRLKVNVYSSFGGSPSVAERYLEPVASLGVENDGKGLEFFIPKEATASVARLLNEIGIPDTTQLIGICPTSRHANKMWLPDRFAEVAAALTMKNGGSVVVLGSKDEMEQCRIVADMVNAQGGNASNLAGKISLTETAAVMDRCSVVVCNDSGLMHIAAARKRKVVAIFGPTVRELGFYPYGTFSEVVEHPSLACRPCTHIGLPSCPEGHFKCMREISSRTVLTAAERLLHQ